MRHRLVLGWPWLIGVRRQLVVADVVAFLGAALLVAQDAAVVCGTIAVALACCVAADGHRDRLHLSVRDDLARLVPALMGATAALIALGPLRVRDAEAWSSIVLFAAAAAALVLGARSAVYAVARETRRSGLTARPVIVVGTGTGTGIGTPPAVEALREHAELGLVPVGVIGGAGGSGGTPVPVLGALESLEWAMVDLGVDDVVFDFAAPPRTCEIEAVDRALRHRHHVFVVPGFFDGAVEDRTRGLERVGRIDVVSLPDWGPRPYERFGRRVVDLALAGLSLLVLAPLLLLLATAVRAEMGHCSVLLRRQRVDPAGRTYVAYRFRTLRTPEFAAGTTVWRIDNDSRIGPVGRLLRRTRLDELPRLVNVLRGDFSLFPTRSARPAFVGEFPRGLAAPAETVITVPGARRPTEDTHARARALK